MVHSLDIIDANMLKNMLMKMKKETVCEAFASTLYQLLKNDIYFSGFSEEQKYIEFWDGNEVYHKVPGRTENVKLEDKVTLDFTKFLERNRNEKN